MWCVWIEWFRYVCIKRKLVEWLVVCKLVFVLIVWMLGMKLMWWVGVDGCVCLLENGLFVCNGFFFVLFFKLVLKEN